MRAREKRRARILRRITDRFTHPMTSPSLSGLILQELRMLGDDPSPEDARAAYERACERLDRFHLLRNQP